MHRTKLMSTLGAFLLGLSVAAVPGAAPATAVATPHAASLAISVGPGEDRQISVPASWWTYNGVSAATVSSLLSSNGARLTDIKVESTTPTFTVTMVKNSGAYASGWWWYYGLTATQVVNTANANNARPTVVHGYNTASGPRFAVIMISNTGANAEAWSFYYGTPSYLAGKITSSNKMVSFGRIQGTSYYTAVFGSNTSTNATGWWWYFGKSMAQLSSLANTNHARLVDLDRNNSTGTYNGLMYSNSGTRWKWYTGYSATGLVNKALQDGQRLMDVSPYYVSGNKRFAAIGTNNLNALGSKLQSQIAPKLDSGAWGFYLRQVSGGQLAGLLQSNKFEPASALKVLYHFKSIDAQEGGVLDSASVTYHYNTADPTNAGICPDNYATTLTTNLKNADQQMMWNSDNRMTRGILEKYGKPAMLSQASTLGMTSTAINHNIGCPTAATHNWTSLTDLGKLYENFQLGSIITTATWKANFRSRMLNQSNFNGFKNTICPVVQQEASKLGKSATVATNFCNKMTWIAKGGSYQYGGAFPYTVDWSSFSLTGVPFKARGVIVSKYFSYGHWINNVQLNSSAEKTSVSTALATLYPAALRPQIKAALQSGW